MQLDEITLETAKPLLDQRFQVTVSDGVTLEMKLIDAMPFESPRRPVRGARKPKREAFSLYFLGPTEPMLEQGMYDFRAEAVELKGLFIVPVGRDEEGTEYEAVFA